MKNHFRIEKIKKAMQKIYAECRTQNAELCTNMGNNKKNWLTYTVSSAHLPKKNLWFLAFWGGFSHPSQHLKWTNLATQLET